MKTPHPQKTTDPPRALRGLLPILVVLGLVVLTLSSFLVLRTPENSQAVNNAPTPSVTFAPAPGAIAPSATPVGAHSPTAVRLPTSEVRAIAPGPSQPSTQAIKSTFTPYVLPTRTPGGIAPRGTTVIPYGPPTPYVTLTRGPDGRIAPGGIPVTPAPTHIPRETVLPGLAATGEKPPACTFPLARTTTIDSAPETYTFSEPKSVPLNSSWHQVSLYQWLPDNQRVLVGYTDKVDPDDPLMWFPEETIALYNPQTGESQDFGSRLTTARPPVWIPGLNAVVYPESHVLTPSTLRPDGQGWLPLLSFDVQRRLWFSRGDRTHLQTLVDERVTVMNDRPSQFGEEFTVVASPDGSEIAYLDSVGRQLYKQQVVQGAFRSEPSPPFDATQWIYRPPGCCGLQIGWSMTWRPNSRQVFLYNRGGAWTSSYTFLLDVPSGQVCELNLWTEDPDYWRQSWAPRPHWSPNGRYLAVVSMKGDGYKDDGSSDLTVLDTATGNLYRIDSTQLSPAGVPKERWNYIADVAWAPDNRHLAAIAEMAYCTSNCDAPSPRRLFLVDFLTGQAVQVSSVQLGKWNWPNDDLLWSSDGSQMIVPAPIGLYLFSVQRRVQP